MLWWERNKTEWLNIDTNDLAKVRWDDMKKKRLTDAGLSEIKNEVKTIKIIKEKVVVTEQPENESEDWERFVGLTVKRYLVKVLVECKVTVEDLLCDTEERI